VSSKESEDAADDDYLLTGTQDKTFWMKQSMNYALISRKSIF